MTVRASDGVPRFLLLTGLALSVLVRGLRLFTDGGALSYDEILLSLTTIPATLSRLLEPLDLGQTAPPLFLLLTRLSVAVLGASALALKLLPLLAGILLVPASGWLAWRLAGSGAALLVMALLLAAPGLQEYAWIYKPYGVDALYAVLLLGATHEWTRNLSHRGWRRTWMALVVLGPLLSSPSVFLIPAVGVALLLELRHRGVSGVRTAILVAGGGAAALLALLGRTIHREVSSHTTLAGRYMIEYWNPYFLVDGPEGLVSRGEKLAQQLLVNPLIERDGAVTLPDDWRILAFLLGIGLLVLWKTRGVGPIVWLAGPLALVVFASMMRRYPVYERLVLFATPGIAIMIGVGLHGLLRGAPRALYRPALVLFLVLILSPLPSLVLQGMQGTGDEDRQTRILSAAKENPQRPVYVANAAAPLWFHYVSGDSADRDRVRWLLSLIDLESPHSLFRPSAELSPLPPDPGPEALRYRNDHRVELLGRRSGMRSTRRGQTMPNARWAEHEVARIRGEADPCTDLVLFALYQAEVHALLVAIHDAGGRVASWSAAFPEDVLLTACFSESRPISPTTLPSAG